MKKKITITIICAVLSCVCLIGTTFAWLTAKTDPITNTFTVGDINITLTEGNALDLKMIPGKEITKDPKVTVKANSEACWLFVKIEKSTNFDTYMTFDVADGWTVLSGQTGVYYREVGAVDADTDFYVIKNNQVKVSEDVTKTELQAAASSAPTLTFTAYAVQQEGVADATTAWGHANP